MNEAREKDTKRYKSKKVECSMIVDFSGVDNLLKYKKE